MWDNLMPPQNWRCSHGWLRGEQCELCKERAEHKTKILDAQKEIQELKQRISNLENKSLTFGVKYGKL